MALWINEFHYDNVGTDVDEFIEIAGPAGTDLSGWSLVLYNGAPADRGVYNTRALSGVIPDQQSGFGTIAFFYPVNGIQNGAPDGIALVNGTSVVQFLSYEGSFTAANGPAVGLTSTDIGVAQEPPPAVGFSLSLVGAGTAYDDFLWDGPVLRSPGAVNVGQSFGDTVTVSVSGGAVIEGDSGTTPLVFTVTRSDSTTAFTVDYATLDGTAIAGEDYIAASGTLVFEVGGPLSQSVEVLVRGDTQVEPDEVFTLSLSGLVPVTGVTVLGTATATGTILNDDIALTPIYMIQGAGHKSPFVGGPVGSFGNSGAVRVTTEGVVTAITTNGFWIQDPVGDGDDATSDGIFVFTSAAPSASISVGETVRVTGRVDEFRPGGTGGVNNLTITQLNASVSGSGIVELGGFTEIAPVVLGVDRVIPTGAIASDGYAVYDPTTFAADFWESLEGMWVEVPQSRAVSPTSNFRTRDPANPANAEGPPNQEIWVVVPGTEDPASATGRGGLIIAPGDFNPERIQIDDLLPAIDLPQVDVGTTLGPVRGVVGYDFANYEVLVPVAPEVLAPTTNTREPTFITRDFRQVTVGNYNVLNLDPKVEDVNRVAGADLYTRLGNVDDDIGSGQYLGIARQIAVLMGAPTIVALQEIQDNDGAEISDVVAADLTLRVLVDLIAAEFGITYAFAEVPPPAPNLDGGQPNGNIRPAFLYRPDQVELLSVRRFEDPDPLAADGFPGDNFASSRKPLIGEFALNGVSFTIVNNHLNSKGGDQPLFGNTQPPVLNSEVQRRAQAETIRKEVERILDAAPEGKVLVLGDLNDFGWSPPVQTLLSGPDGQVLWNLYDLIPVNQRYSYNFQGNAQALDHILASEALRFLADPLFQPMHVNSEFADQVSDHDPLLARFDFRAFGETLVLTAGDDSIDGMGGDDLIFGLAGDDWLLGGAGDDTLVGGAGDDRLDGGPGSDTASYEDAPAAVRVMLTLAGPQDTRGAGRDTLISIENLIGSAFGDTLMGDMQANRIWGGGGNDTITGVGGDNFLYGGDGNDLIRGGNGRDWIEGGAGDDLLFGGAGADLFVFGLDDGTNRIADFLRAQGDRILLLGGDEGDLTLTGSGFVFGHTVVSTVNVPALLPSDFLFA